MFNCQSCKRVTNPHEPAHKFITETRDREYDNHGVITYGSEIVKEITICQNCYIAAGKNTQLMSVNSNKVS